MCLITAVPRSRLQFAFRAHCRHFSRSSHLTSASCHSAEFQGVLRRAGGEAELGRAARRSPGHVNGWCVWLRLNRWQLPKVFQSCWEGNILNSRPCCWCLHHVWDAELRHHDDSTEFYMCLGLWSNHSSQNTIWEQRERTVARQSECEECCAPLKDSAAVSLGFGQ